MKHKVPILAVALLLAPLSSICSQNSAVSAVLRLDSSVSGSWTSTLLQDFDSRLSTQDSTCEFRMTSMKLGFSILVR